LCYDGSETGSRNHGESIERYETAAFDATASEVHFRHAWDPNLSDFQVLDTWWQRFFDNELIPWKKADRRSKFKKAYKELAPYIERHEKVISESQVRKQKRR